MKPFFLTVVQCYLILKLHLFQIYINIFGFIALNTSLIRLLLQVYKAYITKLTRDVSMQCW
jgi:hypothetical protein